MLKLPSYWRDEALLRRGMAYGVFLLCAYTVWMRAGVYFSLLWPLALLSALLCISVFMLPGEQRRSLGCRILRDPVFWFGSAFLLLLGIQWINSGYDVVVPVRGSQKWIPWAIKRIDVAEMLNWFFSVFVILLVVRNVLKRADIKVLMHLLVWNGALLACVGILQRLLESDGILGIWEAPRRDFFATFDYPNHAAAWFYLHSGLAAGLAHDAEVKRKPRVRLVVWGACFMCCIVASCLTLSRFGSFVALIQLATVFIVLLYRTRRSQKRRAAFNVYAVMAIVALIGITLFFGVGGGSLAKEVGDKPLLGERSIAGDISGRLRHVARARAMIRDYPVFGAGAWGCDGLVDLYIPEKELRSWTVGGRLNAHCDPVQFLAEFGLVGGMCMAVVVVVLARDAVLAKRNVLIFWLAGGLVAVLLHSLIDLPFRCPAILLEWSVLLALLSKLARRRHLI